MIVTQHAVDRYIERIDPRATAEDALAALRRSEPAVHAAQQFGATCVVRGDGSRLILDGDRVVTVLAKGQRQSMRADQHTRRLSA